jgi:hypothetical protein
MELSFRADLMYDLLNLFKEYQIVVAGALLKFCLSPRTVFKMGLHADMFKRLHQTELHSFLSITQ